MPIGTFARRSGLTPSALRFYADAGLLLPAEVDPITGYRFYSDDQLERAVLLRRLREIDMPLASVKAVLDADPADAIRLVDEHVTAVVDDAVAARDRAAVITASFATEPAVRIATLSGPVLASAINQVLTATTDEPDLAVLGGVRFEVEGGTVTVTATDRYRLSTRTLAGAESSEVSWAATVNGADLRGCLADLRRSPSVRIDASEHGMWLRPAARGDKQCRLVSEPFPDYRAMLDALPEVTTRLELPKTTLLRVLEQHGAEDIRIRVGTEAVAIGDGAESPARVSGPAVEVWFAMTTLYPAIATAVGADVLLDLRGPDQPATIRSADHGDLTTLAMPIDAPNDPNPKERNA